MSDRELRSSTQTIRQASVELRAARSLGKTTPSVPAGTFPVVESASRCSVERAEG